jgi:lipopolysaccharide/colanic/teichoic acid biosynthesis glycosyltransferase
MRIGKDGKPFKMYKFRSMVANAEEQKLSLTAKNEADGPIFKIKDDPRLTRVGRVLRRTSLDELPQLYNVVLGQMSMVGPRPPLPEEVEEYKPWHRQRLTVIGGMTGLWQVSGRSDLTFDELCLLDIPANHSLCPFWSGGVLKGSPGSLNSACPSTGNKPRDRATHPCQEPRVGGFG